MNLVQKHLCGRQLNGKAQIQATVYKACVNAIWVLKCLDNTRSLLASLSETKDIKLQEKAGQRGLGRWGKDKTQPRGCQNILKKIAENNTKQAAYKDIFSNNIKASSRSKCPEVTSIRDRI